MQNDKYGYLPIEEWQWRSYDGKRKVIVDDFIKDHKEDYFFIGTDSKNYSKKHQCVFTTVLIAYKYGHGGSIIVHSDKVPYMDSLRQRLLMEAMRSLEIAWYLDKRIPSRSFIGIHLDVNQSLKFKSGKYKDELVGMIVSQNFKCQCKPDAWAANQVADRMC